MWGRHENQQTPLRSQIVVSRSILWPGGHSISFSFRRSAPAEDGATTVREGDEARGYEKMAEDVEVLTTEEAAELLRVSTKTILSLAREGLLPGEKVGRAWRFLRADLIEYLHGHHRRQTSAVAS